VMTQGSGPINEKTCIDSPLSGYLIVSEFVHVFAGVSQGLHLADKTWEDQICRVKSQNEGKYTIEDQDNG